MLRPTLLTLLLAAPALCDEPAADRPNVLLILTDDQGWGDIGSHGNPKIDTPNLDRLAAEGARFERFFVSPVCAPTRACLLTGRYSLRTGTHGVTRGYETMRSSEITIAELLRDAGYATAAFGKWHNGAHWPEDPHGQGFDAFGGFCAGHWNNYFDPLLPHPPPHAPTRIEPLLPAGPARVEGYIADIFTDAAVRFIGDRKDGPDPWFCYVPYNTPHWPAQVSDELYEKYAARGLNPQTAAAYAMCENVDRNVGRLLAALEAWGLGDDTVVLFLTDNGPNSDRFNGGMRGRKGSCHEGGVRVPLFVRYPPRIEPGTVVGRNAAHVDLLPTLCELCGVEPPADRPIDGRSLVPLLTRTAAGEFWEDRRLFTFKDWNGDVPTGDRGAVRTDRWRCVKDGPRWELFDMLEDPGETTDVGDQYFEVRKDLADAFAAKWAEVTAAGFAPIPITLDPPGGGWVELPAHEATLHGDGISYVGEQGWANDWVTNWTNPRSFAEWPVRLDEQGTYEIKLVYAATPEQKRRNLQIVSVADVPDLYRKTAEGEFVPEQRLIGMGLSVREPHEAAAFPAPDRFDRGEVNERAWRETEPVGFPMPVGTYALRLGGEFPSGGARNAAGAYPEIKAVRVRLSRSPGWNEPTGFPARRPDRATGDRPGERD